MNFGPNDRANDAAPRSGHHRSVVDVEVQISRFDERDGLSNQYRSIETISPTMRVTEET